MKRAIHSLLSALMLVFLIAIPGCDDGVSDGGGSDSEIETWSRTFGGSDDDWGESVRETSDGGFVITGATSSYGAGNSDVWLIRTDGLGNELWNRTFGGSDGDDAFSVQETSDGGFGGEDIISGGKHVTPHLCGITG